MKKTIAFIGQNSERLSLRPSMIAHIASSIETRILSDTEGRNNNKQRDSVSTRFRATGNRRHQSKASQSAQVTRMSQMKKTRRFTTFAALFVALYLHRTASAAQLVNLLSQMHALLTRVKDEQLSLCMTALLSLLCLVFLERAQNTSALTDLSGDCVELEDMYGKILPVPLIFLEGTNTFAGFLLDQYAGSDAESFIRDGHYNITIGRRDGPAFNQTEAEDRKRLVPSIRLIMAVHWRRLVRWCSVCTHALCVTVGTWIAW